MPTNFFNTSERSTSVEAGFSPEHDAEKVNTEQEAEKKMRFLARAEEHYADFAQGKETTGKVVYYEEMEPGMSFEETFEITDDVIEDFAVSSGDYNPAHTNPEYAKDTQFGGVILHGMFTNAKISRLLGNELPGTGTIFMGLNTQFRAPVRLGDKLTVYVKVKEKRPKGVVVFDVGARVGDLCVVEGDATVLAIDKGNTERKIEDIQSDLEVMGKLRDTLASFSETKDAENSAKLHEFLSHRVAKDAGEKGAFWAKAKTVLDAMANGAEYDAEYWMSVAKETDKYIANQEKKLRYEVRKITPLHPVEEGGE